jgi:site-specific DNA-methyltransferase (adenine-specific)
MEGAPAVQEGASMSMEDESEQDMRSPPVEPIVVKMNITVPDVQQIPVSQILFGERCRRKYTGIIDFAKSLEKFGLNHPLVVSSPHDGFYTLRSGGRRFKALTGPLALDTVPCVVRDDWDEVKGKEWELEENIQRENIDWPSRAEFERQLHQMLVERARKSGNNSWTVADTANRVPAPGAPANAGTKVSAETLRRDIQIAGLLKQRPDIADAVRHLPLHAAIRRASHIQAAEQAAKETINVEGKLRRGHSRDLLKDVESASVACVLTDPPFGINTLDQNRGSGTNVQTSILRDSDNLNSVQALKLMDWFIPELHRVLLPGGHFYIFWCQQNWHFLRERVLQAGLELQEYPVLWLKRGTTVPGRGYLYAPCTELIMFGWKPPRTRLLERSMSAVVECSAIKGGIHPFQKPVDLLKTLILQSTIQGEIVLDPFAGSGSTVVAAIATRRRGLGFDLDPDNSVFPLACKRIEKALKEKGELDPALLPAQLGAAPAVLVKDFHDTRPGQPEWLAFWKAHPDQQDAMLKWMLELKREQKEKT